MNLKEQAKNHVIQAIELIQKHLNKDSPDAVYLIKIQHFINVVNKGQAEANKELSGNEKEQHKIIMDNIYSGLKLIDKQSEDYCKKYGSRAVPTAILNTIISVILEKYKTLDV